MTIPTTFPFLCAAQRSSRRPLADRGGSRDPGRWPGNYKTRRSASEAQAQPQTPHKPGLRNETPHSGLEEVGEGDGEGRRCLYKQLFSFRRLSEWADTSRLPAQENPNARPMQTQTQERLESRLATPLGPAPFTESPGSFVHECQRTTAQRPAKIKQTPGSLVRLLIRRSTSPRLH